jgi:hypothetical protein
MILCGRFWRRRESAVSAVSDDKVLVIETTVQVYGAGTLLSYRPL